MAMLKQAAPLREQAVTILRERIVRGELQAGQRLIERVLVEELDVSRTVVREALRQLESERLIRIEPHVGPLVEELTAEEARQLYEVRAALEGAAARLAAEHRTDAELRELHEALLHIDEHFEPFDELLAAKERFYAALIAASHNQIIGEQLAGVQARISQLRRVTLQQPSRGRQMVGELQRVVNAVAARDRDAAFAASIEHVSAAAQIAAAHFQEQPEE
ncbi:GntR family transcriptional regulator [Leucobacter aridicollis]|uniref:GntR family transcriptional regulator n=1 Tax=Leucobacter aridicollis TaxID=283878 RepID=UPI000E656930|nr:GntR family transcriptional regulator [Leucobacter aridicollis]UTX53607.1 GntR family transcriptional regulator [Leucobacter aridicollis]